MRSILDPFIDDLIRKSMPSEKLTPEIVGELKLDITDRLDNFLLDQAIDTFSDADVDTFDQMIKEKKPPEELAQFVQSRISDYPKFMKENLQKFQELYTA